MAGSHESNPVTRKTSSSKKHKSKSGKSRHERSRKSGQNDEHHEEHHEHREVSGQTPGQDENIQGQPETSGRVADQAETSGQEQAREAKRKGKKVQFAEEPSSKKQRVEEDDPTVYRDGALEPVAAKFETSILIFNHGLFIDLNKIDELGFPHLRPYLERYMPWLGINQDYNVNVLRVSVSLSQAGLSSKRLMGKSKSTNSPSLPL